MRRLVILANPGYDPSRRRELMAELRAVGHKVINVRVDDDHLEVDVLDGDLQGIAAVVGSRIVDYAEVGKEAGSVCEALEMYVRYFNARRYWEAHEVLESVWRISRDATLQGLILIAAGMVKLQEGDRNSMYRLLGEGLNALAVDRYGCLDVAGLVEGVKAFMGGGPRPTARCHED